MALGFGAAVVHLAHVPGDLTFVRDTGVALGLAFYPWVFVMVAASSNGVNLTDGLDGLASGTTALVLAAFVVIAFWKFRHACGSVGAGPACYRIDPAQALDDAIVAGGTAIRAVRKTAEMEEELTDESPDTTASHQILDKRSSS